MNRWLHAARRAVAATAQPALAVAGAFGLGGIALALLGHDPLHLYARLFADTFGSGYGFGQVLFKATTLLGTGLAVAVARHAGLFNIGVEGQMALGGLVAAAAALGLGPECPAAIAIPATLLAGAAAGAAWAAIPAWMRAWRGVHEVIATILLNFIAFALVGFVLVRFLAEFESLHTAEIPPGARLPRLEVLLPALRGAPANFDLVVVLGLCLVTAWIASRTRWGFEVRAVGMSERAAAAAGIPVRRRMFEAMVASGALAGAAAANFVQGYKHYFEDGFTAEAGFKGIAVALLARSHPLALVPAAILFGALDRGAFVIGGDVPKEFVDMLQALVLLGVVIAMRRRVRRVRVEAS